MALLTAVLILPTAKASDREDDVNRIGRSARVFKEIMDTPDKGIPHDLLHRAKCIAIIPGDVKFAFIFGVATEEELRPVVLLKAEALRCS